MSLIIRVLGRQFLSSRIHNIFIRSKSTKQKNNKNNNNKQSRVVIAHLSKTSTMAYKKLSCRRETARRFVSLNILLSHSRSLKVIRDDTVEYGVCKSLLVFHWNYVCISYRFWDIQRQRMAWPWYWGRGGSRSLKMAPFDRSHTTFYWSAIVSTAVCGTVLKLFDVE